MVWELRQRYEICTPARRQGPAGVGALHQGGAAVAWGQATFAAGPKFRPTAKRSFRVGSIGTYRAKAGRVGAVRINYETRVRALFGEQVQSNMFLNQNATRLTIHCARAIRRKQTTRPSDVQTTNGGLSTDRRIIVHELILHCVVWFRPGVMCLA